MIPTNALLVAGLGLGLGFVRGKCYQFVVPLVAMILVIRPES